MAQSLEQPDRGERRGVGGSRPLVGLVLCAAIGILVADFSPVTPQIWTAVFAGALLLCNVRLLFPLFVVCAFATVHAWRVQESSALVLAQYFESAGPVLLEGEAVVRDAPAPLSGVGARQRSQFPADLVTLHSDGKRLPVKARVLISWTGQAPEYGDLVSFHATAENIAGPRNPGQFDARKHYKRQGIHTRFSIRNAKDGKVVEGGHGNPLRRVALQSCFQMEEWLRMDLHDAPDVAEVLAGVVLGSKTAMDDEVRAKFRNTGTLHLFAVSGLHVGMFALLLWLLLRPLPVRRARLIWIIVPLLLFYALITGLRPSVVRATLMTVIVLGGFLLDRRASLANNLAAAAVLLLAVDSHQLFTSGFQLSFAVVTAILFLAGPLSRKFAGWGRPDEFLPEKLWNWREKTTAWSGHRVGQLAAVSLAAGLGSAPLMFVGFNLVTPLGVLVNMLVVPIAFVVLSLGLLAIATAPVSATLAVLFNNSNWLVVKVMLGVIDFFAAVPGCYFRVATQLPARDTVAEVTVFDAGTGGAAALHAAGFHWLVDTGNERDMRGSVGPALWRRGVNRLDGLLLTHGDARHIGGAELCIEDFAPERILHSALADRSPVRRKLAALMKRMEMGAEFVRPGMKIGISQDLHWEVLYPPPGLERRLADDKAVIVLLTAGPTRVLLLSDAGVMSESWLMEQHPDLHCDVVVRGWHARDFSGDPGLYTRLGASLIVTAAPDPRGAPEFESVWTESAEEAVQWGQENTGAVLFRFYADGFEAEAFLTGEIFTNRAR